MTLPDATVGFEGKTRNEANTFSGNSTADGLGRGPKPSSILSSIVQQRNIRRQRMSCQSAIGKSIDDLPLLKRQKIEEGVASKLRELNLSLGVPRSLLGSRVLKTRSTNGYIGYLRRLAYFSALSMDFESLLCLREDAPTYCPAISSKTIVLFLSWVSGKKGELLIDPDSGERVPSLFGGFVTNDGTWRSPHNSTPFAAAISLLHSTRGMGHADYQEPCDACIEKYQRSNTQDVSGCRFHTSGAHLFRRGNPRFHADVRNRIRKLFIEDFPRYQQQRDSQLLPSELLKLRDACLSPGSHEGIRLWTISLLSIRLLLRSEEALPFDGDSGFIPEMTSIDSNGRVNQLAIVIQGKRDKSPVTLLLNRDDEMPEFCPVRTMLTWVHVSGWKGGPLFPKVQGGNVAINSKTYLKTLKRVCADVTKRDGPWGTHTCRYTGALLSVWGNASDLALQHDLRHKDSSMTQRYKADSLGQLQVARNNRCVLFSILSGYFING